jgi:dTDP-4-amino-4,6-dideoxygalactose transaminase
MSRSSRRVIGGELELPVQALIDVRPEPLGLPGRSVVSGRTGLRLVARSLEGPVLLPSYLCASVIQPFGEEGLPVAFYRVRADLSVDVDDLVSQARTTGAAAVLVISYFGFPYAQDLTEALVDLRSRCRVIEDCVHGSLLEFADSVVGGVGDFVVTSFRKYLPVPDGGVVTGPAASDLPELPEKSGAYVRWRALAKVLCQEHLDGGAPDEVASGYRSLFLAAERLLDRETPLFATSRLSGGLLAGLDLAAAAARRRENFRLLAGAFRGPELASIGRPLLPQLPDAVSPLLFPILVDPERRDRIRDALRAEGVFLPVHWPVPARVDPDRQHDSVRLASSILSLHVDQRYGPNEMEAQIAAVRSAWASVG